MLHRWQKLEGILENFYPNVACPGSKTTEYFKYYICERISMISKNVTSELKLDTQRGEI